MKFPALLKKELRECLPWLLLAAAVFLFFSSLSLRSMQLHREDYARWNQPSGATISPWDLKEPMILSGIGHILLAVSIGLGLVLGVLQFLLPWLMKTWAFTLHRSVRRVEILGAKTAAAAITFAASLGLIWTGVFWYASQPEILPLPPRAIFYGLGWIYILCGFIVYLGAALAGLSDARWYTTRVFGVGLSVFILWWALIQWQVAWCLAVLAAGLVLLGVQLINLFLKREF
jgi:hypothetical protein